MLEKACDIDCGVVDTFGQDTARHATMFCRSGVREQDRRTTKPRVDTRYKPQNTWSFYVGQKQNYRLIINYKLMFNICSKVRNLIRLWLKINIRLLQIQVECKHAPRAACSRRLTYPPQGNGRARGNCRLCSHWRGCIVLEDLQS